MKERRNPITKPCQMHVDYSLDVSRSFEDRLYSLQRAFDYLEEIAIGEADLADTLAKLVEAQTEAMQELNAKVGKLEAVIASNQQCAAKREKDWLDLMVNIESQRSGLLVRVNQLTKELTEARAAANGLYRISVERITESLNKQPGGSS